MVCKKNTNTVETRLRLDDSLGRFLQWKQIFFRPLKKKIKAECCVKKKNQHG